MIIINPLLVILFIAKFSILNAQTCPYFQTDIDYQGFDINYTFTSSVQSCCNLCAAVPSCSAFTFIQASQACWLKYSVGTSYNAIGRISGVVTARNTIITNTPLTTTPTSTYFTTTSSTTTTIGTSTKTYGCFIENNINYYGNDFLATYVNSASDCCNLCGQTQTCVVWAFLTNVKYCYLKNAVPPISQRQNYTNMISGIVTLR